MITPGDLMAENKGGRGRWVVSFSQYIDNISCKILLVFDKLLSCSIIVMIKQ